MYFNTREVYVTRAKLPKVSKQYILGLSTELITKGELVTAVKRYIRVLTFRALARSDAEGLTLETSALEALFGGQCNLPLVFNSVDKPNIRLHRLHRPQLHSLLDLAVLSRDPFLFCRVKMMSNFHPLHTYGSSVAGFRTGKPPLFAIYNEGVCSRVTRARPLFPCEFSSKRETARSLASPLSKE